MTMLPRAPEMVQRHAETWRRYGDPTQWTNPDQPTTLQLSWEASSWPISGPARPVVVWPDPAFWPLPDGTWADRWWTVADGLVRKSTRFLLWTLPGKAPGIVVPCGGLRGAQGTTDLGLLIDDDPNHPELGGWEILGLRSPWPWEHPALGALSGGGFDAGRGDLVASTVARRTPLTAERILEDRDVQIVVGNEVLFLGDVEHRVARPGHADADIDGLLRLRGGKAEGGGHGGRARK